MQFNIKLLEVGLSNSYFKRLLRTHYPQSKGIVGRRVNFVIFKDNLPVGIIGFASPPLSYQIAENFLNLPKELKPSERAKLYLNNNIFRLEIRERNLGTQVLKEARKRVKELYKQKYGDDLIGLITFVKPPLTGAVYKADNWRFIGYTKGYKWNRKNGKWRGTKSDKTNDRKLIFGYKYKEE